MATEAARNYWYPVAMVENLDHGVIGCRLLGERLAVFRANGHLAALNDLCIHRGTPLSMGRVEDGELVCAYHGWRYETDGKVVRIPQLESDRHIPTKARVRAYKVEERYGAVWVCLGEPRLPIPAFPESDDPTYKVVFTGTSHWQSSAARMLENFMDTAHFAWVHEGLLGDPSRPEVTISPIERFDDGFGFTTENDIPGPNGWVREPSYNRYGVPYTLWISRIRAEEDQSAGVQGIRATAGVPPRHANLTAIQPVDEKECIRYTWIAFNYDLGESEENFWSRTAVIREQDRVIVEAQRPEELPLDLSAEMHLKGIDAAAVEFRRMLKQFDLE